jgi:hypothetical protein
MRSDTTEEATVAGKSDFTEAEWEQLRRGVTGAGLLVATSDRSFFDSFKEASSMAKYLAASRSAESPLVSELASEHGIGFGFTDSASEVETGALEALRAATATLRAKAPDEVEPYRLFVLELARSVGRAAGGGDAAETGALGKIETALD